ncbi:chemotaxis protein CheA [Natranaerofaba carboxydovora]|uniref:chemotaxis protein CheA n=1 Tax=Natranaerofaba carboxydovora TaxID=2742683 RepID=UPI001F144990|nr:chemotaxis protein CheA [Natranaerofaba carboxydovora]UMZ73046.1 Chemotaxis protein CheA [Natranaerofaba carboxydovora]
MSDNFNSPMLEMYTFEADQMVEKMEKVIMDSEREENYSREAIDEIFRAMHTIKGSSATMFFNDLATLAHSMEDLFYFLREGEVQSLDCSALTDLVLEGVDFIKVELQKIKNGDEPDGDASAIIDSNQEFLTQLKVDNSIGEEIKKPETEEKVQYYIPPEKTADSKLEKSLFKSTIFLQDDCDMENVRCFTIVRDLTELAEEIFHTPEDLVEDTECVRYIRDNGFTILLKTAESYETIDSFFENESYIKNYELIELKNEEEFDLFRQPRQVELKDNAIKTPQSRATTAEKCVEVEKTNTTQSIISVNVDKLDMLMDTVGELVIAEAMVTQNPEIVNLELENFQKASRQLHKITTELQDMVMSIRMVPLSTTFHKMHRIVRDITKKQNKEVELKIRGEETEVDKNIIEHISDPLMHLVRNSIDHGIESSEEREKKNKEKVGNITIEAKNSGSDVLIIIKDDGKGLDKEKILQKAFEKGLIENRDKEMTDKEIYNMILIPGFSTKDDISEFSGRGVGMDVVNKNLEVVGGSVGVDSEVDVGTSITLKIPLTLAIIDGMNLKVGNSRFTIPLVNIKESFRPKEKDCLKDPDDNEMVMVRGECYPILRLHEYFNSDPETEDFASGILVMVEHDEKKLCLFADGLLGQQQVVVKALPTYIKNIKNIKGLAGCTLLGDGSISLILDVGGLSKVN